jgi:hypothetical protein
LSLIGYRKSSDASVVYSIYSLACAGVLIAKNIISWSFDIASIGRFHIGFFSFKVPFGARKMQAALRGLLDVKASVIRLTT